MARHVPVFVDKHLAFKVSGIDVAKRLFRDGFENIYLATGDEVEQTEDLSFLTGIQGKSFPKEFKLRITEV